MERGREEDLHRPFFDDGMGGNIIMVSSFRGEPRGPSRRQINGHHADQEAWLGVILAPDAVLESVPMHSLRCWFSLRDACADIGAKSLGATLSLCTAEAPDSFPPFLLSSCLESREGRFPFRIRILDSFWRNGSRKGTRVSLSSSLRESIQTQEDSAPHKAETQRAPWASWLPITQVCQGLGLSK